MSERIDSLKRLIEKAYNCKANHAASTPIREMFRGELVWEGVIETFDLEGVVNSSRCYAFEFVLDDQPEVRTVLAVDGIDSPHKALQAAIAASSKKAP